MGVIDPRYPPPTRLITAESLIREGRAAWNEFFAALTPAQLQEIGDPHKGLCNWSFWARDEQIAPTGDWSTWFYLAGRGSGKTRSGAEWVLDEVRRGTKIIHLIAPTEGDYRDVMIYGPAGLIAIAPPTERPKVAASGRKLVFPNGAYALCFSAEKPERLRGPQCEAAWCDEVAAWRYVDHTWDMMSFGLRLGRSPRVMVSTTPKPIPLIKRLVKDPTCAVTRGTTYDNEANLAEKFFRDTVARYEGTRLGRQELLADILTDNPDALFSYSQLDRLRVQIEACPRSFSRIVVAVDPPASTGDDAREVIEQANRQYTGLVGLPIREVHAKQGKIARAEPVSMLYQQGRVHPISARRNSARCVVDNTPLRQVPKLTVLRLHRPFLALKNKDFFALARHESYLPTSRVERPEFLLIFSTIRAKTFPGLPLTGEPLDRIGAVLGRKVMWALAARTLTRKLFPLRTGSGPLRF